MMMLLNVTDSTGKANAMISPCDFMNEPRAWIEDSSVKGRRRPELIISDGSGDALRLDLAQPGMDELAQACKALLESKLLPGVCLIRVLAGETTYRLRYVMRFPFRFGITRMDAQEREITISEDALREVIGILNTTVSLRAPFSAPRSSLITYTL